jgi:hypothetical protein
MKKIISYDTGLISEDPNVLLEEVMTKLRSAMIIYSIDPDSGAGKEIVDSLTLLDQAQLLLSSRSRTSSIHSVASLGNRIADYDKDLLYTYHWGRTGWTSMEDSKGDFQKWLEGGYKLPSKGSILNCWESVITILYLYNAVDKHDILNAFVEGKSNRNSDGSAKCIGTDAEIIGSFLGLWGPTHRVASLADVKPGDIISFADTYDTDMVHVAITFEEAPNIRLGSFWNIPEEKMILISPEKLLSVSKNAANLSDTYEHIDPDNIKISNKFRLFFQGLVTD